jgi:hypothetical protein
VNNLDFRTVNGVQITGADHLAGGRKWILQKVDISLKSIYGK